jgi:hypothetical protein
MTNAAKTNVKFTAVIHTTKIDFLASDRKVYEQAVAHALSTEQSAVYTKKISEAPHEAEIETTVTVEDEMVASVVVKVTTPNKINTSLTTFTTTTTVENIVHVTTTVAPAIDPILRDFLVAGAAFTLFFVGWGILDWCDRNAALRTFTGYGPIPPTKQQVPQVAIIDQQL